MRSGWSVVKAELPLRIRANRVDHPTAAYIEKYSDVYNNPNLTTWEGAGKLFRLVLRGYR
jgi:hypothetical protein